MDLMDLFLGDEGMEELNLFSIQELNTPTAFPVTYTRELCHGVTEAIPTSTTESHGNPDQSLASSSSNFVANSMDSSNCSTIQDCGWLESYFSAEATETNPNNDTVDISVELLKFDLAYGKIIIDGVCKEVDELISNLAARKMIECNAPSKWAEFIPRMNAIAHVSGEIVARLLEICNESHPLINHIYETLQEFLAKLLLVVKQPGPVIQETCSTTVCLLLSSKFDVAGISCANISLVNQSQKDAFKFDIAGNSKYEVRKATSIRRKKIITKLLPKNKRGIFNATETFEPCENFYVAKFWASIKGNPNRMKRTEGSNVMAKVGQENFFIKYNSNIQLKGRYKIFPVIAYSHPVKIRCHTTQDCDCWETVIWDKATGMPGIFKCEDRLKEVVLAKLVDVINEYFKETDFKFSEDDFQNMFGFLHSQKPGGIKGNKISIWRWLYHVKKFFMDKNLEKLLETIKEENVMGYLTETEIKQFLSDKPSGTYLIRLSNSRADAITISFKDEEKIVCRQETSNTLKQLGLKERIEGYPELRFPYACNLNSSDCQGYSIPESSPLAGNYSSQTSKPVQMFGYLEAKLKAFLVWPK